MESGLTLEKVISIASDLKENLKVLLESFHQLVPVLEKEHHAIAHSALEKLEQVTLEKNVLASQIEQRCQKIKDISFVLIELHQRVAPRDRYYVGNISDCLQLFVEIKDSLRGSGLGIQVLEHVMTGLNKLFEEFVAARNCAQPKIDMNKYLTAKLLCHHQESYQFWQEVAAEMMATYSEAGTQKNQNFGPIISVKA